MKLLDDLLVLDFSQFLSGPSAGLRLADFGCRVIKIEKPELGDICRTLYVSDAKIDGESTIFHAINRRKESLAADLKKPEDLESIKKLIKEADIMIHNFRPGVMERIGLSYEVVKALNPRIIYAEISGYGDIGEWKHLPGQDLLIQAVSGITYLNGNQDDNPMPMGVAVADILTGVHLVQGILSVLYAREEKGVGALIQVSMMESILDFQFEGLTCFYNDGNELPVRGAVNSAHAYIGAPYGIYKTADSAITFAMNAVDRVGYLIGCSELTTFTDPATWFSKRDEIKAILRQYLLQRTTQEWLDILEPADIWCAPVFNYDELVQQEGYKVLEMEQEVIIKNGSLVTTRCPIRVDGQMLLSSRGAPAIGEHTAAIRREFNL